MMTILMPLIARLYQPKSKTIISIPIEISIDDLADIEFTEKPVALEIEQCSIFGIRGSFSGQIC